MITSILKFVTPTSFIHSRIMQRKKNNEKPPPMLVQFKGTIEEVEELLFYGHSIKSVSLLLRKTVEELNALVVKCKEMTLEELAEISRIRLQDYLRRLQLFHAKNNFQMAAFLGKNLLGQRDNPVALPEFSGSLVKVVERLGENLEKYDKISSVKS